MNVENHKIIIVIISLLGSFALAVVDGEARSVFSHMASGAVGGYFGATVPSNPDRTKHILEVKK